jgi:hypothetical protein
VVADCFFVGKVTCLDVTAGTGVLVGLDGSVVLVGTGVAVGSEVGVRVGVGVMESVTVGVRESAGVVSCAIADNGKKRSHKINRKFSISSL